MSSSQQNWLTRATEVCNMSSGPVKQLHTAGDLFLPKTKREDRGDRAMRVGHRTWFKGRRYLYMGRIGLFLHKNQVNSISCIYVATKAPQDVYTNKFQELTTTSAENLNTNYGPMKMMEK